MSSLLFNCNKSWPSIKIFPPVASVNLEIHLSNVDAKTFQENGCIVGVNNASFEVSKGEIMVFKNVMVDGFLK